MRIRRARLANSGSMRGDIKVLVVLPSAGQGGGIERYAAAVSVSLCRIGCSVDEIALRPLAARPVRAKVALVLAAMEYGWRNRPDHVLIMHPGLLPVALMLSVVCRPARICLFFYGSDIWSGGSRWQKFTLRSWKPLQLVTISSFSAGALSMIARVPTIIRPALTPEWHDVLSAAACEPPEREIDLLTVFRLGDWSTKGGPAYLEAVQGLRRRRPITAAAAGRGPVPEHVRRDCEQAGVELLVDVSDEELASLYGRAKVLVLATVLATGPDASGEGFGIVLIEAQAAGCSVVAPAESGSSDAFIPGLTGEHCREGTELVDVIDRLLGEDRSRAAQGLVDRQFSATRLDQDLSRLLALR